MLDSYIFAFVERTNSLGVSSMMPYLPISLTYRSRFVNGMALLDTGASVNVLPYEVGLELGAVWEEQTVPVQLSGKLRNFAFLHSKILTYKPFKRIMIQITNTS